MSSQTLNVQNKKRIRLNKHTYAKRAFSMFVESLEHFSNNDQQLTWSCCSDQYRDIRKLQKHISVNHQTEIDKIKADLLYQIGHRTGENAQRCLNDGYTDDFESSLPITFTSKDDFEWLPVVTDENLQNKNGKGRILLFYRYRWIKNTEHVRLWQKELCTRLHLTGKIRVATEGLNSTVGGNFDATELYIKCVLAHPLFSARTRDDFKTSEGSAADFPDGLRVGVYKEMCPMGVDPKAVPFTKAGRHLTPEEWHEELAKRSRSEQEGSRSEDDTLLIDCRNFYESKIGVFEGALRPDIRKFSYWPEYVECNAALFRDRRVLMYCTGGVRCERGSAYLASKGLCKEVLQLEGGIHKYMERFPDGYFRGKLFVFDDRYSIKSNDDVISTCRYCPRPWDDYSPCSSPHCHQLVLSCPECRSRRGLTACCPTCADNARRILEAKSNNPDNARGISEANQISPDNAKTNSPDNARGVSEANQCNPDNARGISEANQISPDNAKSNIPDTARRPSESNTNSSNGARRPSESNTNDTGGFKNNNDNPGQHSDADTISSNSSTPGDLNTESKPSHAPLMATTTETGSNWSKPSGSKPAGIREECECTRQRARIPVEVLS